jgi:hypothetical protein
VLRPWDDKHRRNSLWPKQAMSNSKKHFNFSSGINAFWQLKSKTITDRGYPLEYYPEILLQSIQSEERASKLDEK